MDFPRTLNPIPRRAKVHKTEQTLTRRRGPLITQYKVEAMEPLPRTERPEPGRRDPAGPSPHIADDTPLSRDDALAIGSRLDEFQIERVIGASGFGVVYMATDLGLQRRVAIKEYLPDTLVVRAPDGAQVLLRAESNADAFERGRQAFVEEAQMLARCHHPSLVHVLRHWEVNGTVYRAMPYYPGTSLLHLRQSMDAPPDEASLRGLLEGLLEALAMLHEAGCVHGEITPSKIMLLPDDRPVLMDWGAARRAIVGDQARALMSLLAPSFAPPEQTHPGPARPIGPWTDLYALAAVVRYCISGQLPSATSLRAQPNEEPLRQMLARMQQTDEALQFSPSFVRAVEAALAPRPQDRPQDVAEFRALLDDHPAAQAVPDDGLDVPEKGRETSWGRISGEDEPWPESPSPHAPSRPAPPAATVPSGSDAPRRDSAPPVSGSPDDIRLARDAYAGVYADRRLDRFDTASISGFRQMARRRRRRVVAGSAMALAAAVGAGLWLVERERDSQEAQSAFARAAREDGLTSRLPTAVPRAPQPEQGASAAGNEAVATETAAEAAQGTTVAAASPAPQASAPSIATPSGTPSVTASAPVPSEPVMAGAARADTEQEVALPPSQTADRSAGTRGSVNTSGTRAAAAARSQDTSRTAARESQSPREVCGSRTQFSLYRCMTHLCEQARWYAHPSCKRLRLRDEVD
jgi:non-specific serine/threonine protein kinase